MLKKYPAILLGIFITLLSLFFFSLVALIPSLMREPYESSNYKEIPIARICNPCPQQ